MDEMKEKIRSSCSMEVDNVNATTDDTDVPENEREEPLTKRAKLDETDTNVTFCENKLFHYLNDPNNLQGRIILGNYKLHKKLDYNRLKEMLVMKEIVKDPENYTIPPTVFESLRDQIVELFIFEEGEFFYVPHERTATTAVSARGCLYSTYKFIRAQLRAAGLLTVNDRTSEIRTEQAQPFECLVNKEAITSTSEVIQKWEESHSERKKLLVSLQTKTQQNTDLLNQYFTSFMCLASPLGTLLDPSDLNEKILEHENWLKANGQTIHPYVVLCGKIDRIHQFSVVLNNEIYTFSTPMAAVQCCFKCLTALQSFPYLTDHIWSFIQKFTFGIYEFHQLKYPANVLKVATEIKKL